MKSLSCRPTAADKTVRLTERPLSLDSAIRRVSDGAMGAVVAFSGCVRETENGRRIAAISYEAYRGMAETELSRIAAQTRARWKVRVEIQHRLGKVPVQEPSLVVACSGVHRREAFEACRFLVDEIKERVPIWKVNFEWI